MFRSSFHIYFAHWVSHVHLMVVPALLPFLPEFFGVGFLELGAGMSILMFVTLCLQIPMGFAVDRFGAKRLLGVGMLLSAFALLSLAIFPSYPWFIAVMAILGVVNTVYHPADYSLLAENVDSSRLGRAFSFHTFAGYLGTAMTPFMMFATVSLLGVSAAFILVALLPVLAVYTLDPVHRLARTGDYRLFSAPPPRATQPLSAEDMELPNLRKSRTNLALKLLSLTLFFACLFASTAPIQDFGNATLMSGYQFDEGSATLLITLFLFVMALGVLLGGWLADKTQHHGLITAYSVVVTTILMAIATFLTFPQWLMYPLLISVGLLLGLVAPSRDMMVKKVAPAGMEGRFFAIVSTGYSIGGALSPLYLAWLLDHDLPRWVFGAAVITMLLVVLLSFAQERSSRTVAVHPVAASSN
ncbi:MAG: MFS transporter [Microbacteriaceae bacterium]